MDDELLDIVDRNDIVVGQDTKENKFQKELISRMVAVFIVDNEGKMIIAKRAPTKRSFPNRLDLAACGNVKAGESYEDAAKREILEELGIECNVSLLKKIFNEFPENGKMIRYFTSIFLGRYDSTVNTNEEISVIRKIPVDEIERMIKQSRELFTPGFVNDFLSVREKLH